jgi:hypothetical protein
MSCVCDTARHFVLAVFFVVKGGQKATAGAIERLGTGLK